YRAAGPLHRVTAWRAVAAAREARRTHPAVVGEYRGGHGFVKGDLPHQAVAAGMRAHAAGAAPQAEAPYGDGIAPFQHFRISEPGIGHVALNAVGAIKAGACAHATADGFVVLPLGVAEGDVVHGALGA